MRYRITFLLVALVALFSCRAQNGLEEGNGGLVQLAVEGVSSKATATNTDNIRAFVVFGSRQGDKLWGDVVATATSDLLFNVEVTKGADDAWSYGTPAKWDDSQFSFHAFFAYAPIGLASNGISLLTKADAVGYQKLAYQTLPNVGDQVDLVVSSHINQTPVKTLELSFVHALTRIGFAAYTNLPGTKVHSIHVRGVNYKGELPIYRELRWGGVAADTTNFEVEMNPAVSVSTDEEKPTDLAGNGLYHFLLLPQDLSANVDEKVAVTVHYEQAGAQLKKSYTLKEKWEGGKSLRYILDLTGALTEDLIVANVVVTDWVFGKAEELDLANAELERYEVTYDANGGVGVPAVDKIWPGDRLVVGAAPTTIVAGKAFAGYATTAAGTGGAYWPGQEVMLRKSVTLYAQWKDAGLSSIAPAAPISGLGHSYQIELYSAGLWTAAVTQLGAATVTPASGTGSGLVTITVGTNTDAIDRLVEVNFALFGVVPSVVWSGTQNSAILALRTAGYITKTNDGTGLPAGLLCVGMFGGHDGTSYTKGLYVDKYGDNTSGVNQGATAGSEVVRAWGYQATEVGGTSHFSGLDNTSQLTNSPAASYCRNKGAGWYLPAIRQLQDGLYAAKVAGILTLKDYVLSADKSSLYWSSTEFNADRAWYVASSNGTESASSKGELNVRCVMEF